MQRTPWIERKFVFDIPPGWMPDIIERLLGTEHRLRAMLTAVSEEQTALKTDNAWSIREHIGHLSDLEELHEGRIDDFMAQEKTLRAADMRNAKTWSAMHNNNNKTAEELLQIFSAQRNTFVRRLLALNDEIQNTAALHPRLQVNMRPVDMAFFTAEHDDHHLATVRELILSFT